MCLIFSNLDHGQVWRSGCFARYGMNETAASTNRTAAWESWQVYVMAAVCLVIGVLVGYLVRGSKGASAPPAVAQANAAPASDPHSKMPSLDDMKRMAD